MPDYPRFFDYAHREAGDEFTAIGGHCVLSKEGILPCGEREVFYLSGYALPDTSCCGMGGCGYALVQSFVRQWRYTKDAEGTVLSRMEIVSDPSVREEIRQRILEKEGVQQVGFRFL